MLILGSKLESVTLLNILEWSCLIDKLLKFLCGFYTNKLLIFNKLKERMIERYIKGIIYLSQKNLLI